MTNSWLVIGAILAIIGAATGGAFVASTMSVERVSDAIAQACSRDGYFDLERSGIVWRHSCGKPKVFLDCGDRIMTPCD